MQQYLRLSGPSAARIVQFSESPSASPTTQLNSRLRQVEEDVSSTLRLGGIASNCPGMARLGQSWNSILVKCTAW